MACKIWEQTSTELVALHAKFATPQQKELVAELSRVMTESRKVLQETNGVLDLAKYNQAKDALSAELMRFAMNEDAYARVLAMKMAKYNGVQSNTYAKAIEEFTTFNDIDKNVLASMGYDSDTLEIIKESIIKKTIEEYDKSKFINATISKVSSTGFLSTVKWFFKNIAGLFKKVSVEAETKIAKLATEDTPEALDEARRQYLRRAFRNDITDDNLYELIAGDNVDADTIEAIMTYKYMNGGYVDFEVAKELVSNQKLNNLIVGNDFWNNVKNIPEDGLEDFIRLYYADSPAQTELLRLIEAKPRGGDLNDAYVELQKLENSRDARVEKGINSRIFDQVFPEYESIVAHTDYIDLKNRVLDNLYEEWISNANLQKKIWDKSPEIQAELFNIKKSTLDNLEADIINKITGNEYDAIGNKTHYIKIKQANAGDNLTELSYQAADFPLSTTLKEGNVHYFDSIEKAEIWIKENPAAKVVANQNNIPEDGVRAEVIRPSRNGYRFEVDAKGKLHLQANGWALLKKLFREVSNVEIPLSQISDELYDKVYELRKIQNNITLNAKEDIYRNADPKVLNDYLNVDYKITDQDAFMIEYKTNIEDMINGLYGTDIKITSKTDRDFLKYFVFDNDYSALDAWMVKKGANSNPVLFSRTEQIKRMAMQANLVNNRANSELFEFVIDNQDKLLRVNTPQDLTDLLDTNPVVKNLIETNNISSKQGFFDNMLSVLQDVSREGSFPIQSKIIPVKESNPLLQEAKKYKSADEFVKWLEKDGKVLYHGTNAKFDEFSLKYFWSTDDWFLWAWVYLTPKKWIAKVYGKNIMKTFADIKNPLIIDDNYSFWWVNPDTIRKKLWIGINSKSYEVRNELIKQGYDWVYVNEILWWNKKKLVEIVWLYPKQIKTETQLKQIREEANAKTKIPTWKKGSKASKIVWEGNNYIVAQLMKQDVPFNAMLSPTEKLPNELLWGQLRTEELFDEYIEKAKALVKKDAPSQKLADLHSVYSNRIKAIQNYYFDTLGSPNGVYSEFKPTRIMNKTDVKAYETVLASSKTYSEQYKTLNNDFWNKLRGYVDDKNELTYLDSLLKYGKANTVADGRIVKVSIDDVLVKVLAESTEESARLLENIGVGKMTLPEKRKALGIFQVTNILKAYDDAQDAGLKVIFWEAYDTLRLIKHSGDKGIYYIPKSVYDQISKSPDAELEDAYKYYRNKIYGEKVTYKGGKEDPLTAIFKPVTDILNKEIWETGLTYKDIILGEPGTNKYIRSLLWELNTDMKNAKSLADSFSKAVGEQLDSRIKVWNTAVPDILNRTDNKFNMVYDLAPPKKIELSQSVPEKVVKETIEDTETFTKTLNDC